MSEDHPHGDAPPSGHPGDHAASEHPGSNPDASSSSHPGGHPGARNYAETPLIVTWEVTQACELECDHCRAEAQPERDPAELSTADGKDFVESIADFGHPQPILVFTGGDPLERPDLFELLKHAAEENVTTAVTPAPTANLTEDVIGRLADAGVSRIALSLDGATASAHDEFRGEDGSFARVEQAARQARAAGMEIQINTTVTANTVEDLPEIADMVEEFDAAMWEVFFLVPIGRGEELAQLETERTVEVMEWLYRRGQEAPYRVITVEAPHYRRVADEFERRESGEGVRVGSTRAGNGFVFVSYEGEVYPSGFLPESGGNVTDRSLVDIYRNADLFERLRDTDQFVGSCSRCDYLDICGGSRSRAHAVTGNPLASDPLCPWVEHVEDTA
ncbi:Coenzyme PQQ synthesis protein [Halorhabdus tiamatea SARL4B]|uniref:Coenzyme PQQ synthesis protein n=1 Tax=Halorhabdus tiamatea SARL4B TaxID=1033806 RepID=S6D781_9EURY|nr:radical SAM protein [Halorhabdus tiamatea]ERJ06885.1 Coenzyme PQQ synthesis protein [Halorhabdus tiamatea SARL4B]CCQ32411.1 radical SAM domain heme biosynthesis protein [Halorhabdus tiamatea SARL4B]